MLKIKFNINEFKIIFLRRFEGKNERKRIFFSVFSALLFSASFFLFVLSVQLLPFSVQPSFFLFCFSTHFLLLCTFLFQPSLFSFLFDVLPFFFQPKILFQPKTFFSPRISPCLWFSASFLLCVPLSLLLFLANFFFSSCFTSLLFE